MKSENTLFVIVYLANLIFHIINVKKFVHSLEDTKEHAIVI